MAVQGYGIPFQQIPSRRQLPPFAFSEQESSIISTEILKLQEKGAVSVTEPGEGCVSNIFLVPKADNKWRLILNLKVLNMYTEHEHFKMEGIDCVRDLLTRREYMCKLDLRDAYLSVPINPSEVSEVSVEGHNISVQCPPIWAGHGPSGLHEDTQTSLGPPKSQGPENHSLPGRPIAHWPKHEGSRGSLSNRKGSPGGVGFCGEQREISH